ncbi:MAG TPA: delta-60 repeat domain-containing protein, partial [Pyrinomonadaceae bacterium]|nr:delta-60 repeat domain-containing protein [Pyrinomonadaceae bacterium]
MSARKTSGVGLSRDDGRGTTWVARRAPSILLAALAALVIFAALAAPHGAQSAEGDLDATFGGGDGRVNDNFGEPYGNKANAVVVQPDGKIVLAAQASFGQERGYDFALARYNPDGSLDPTFGIGGKVVTNINLGGDIPHALALQPDGKIIAVGESISDQAGITTTEYTLVRYNPDGSLDPSFGGDGIVVTDLFGNGDTAFAVALQPDGKIVAAGSSAQNGTGANFSAARYNPDGSLDTTFGSPVPGTASRSGRVMTDLVAWNDIGRAVALQADGRIVIAGHTQTPSTNNYDFALLRYEADGDLDTTFGGDGWVTTRFFEDDFVDDERAFAVRAQPDGKIVAAGFAWDRNETQPASQWEDFALARYNADGSLDPTFGAGGLVWTNISIQPGGADKFNEVTKDRAHALLLQPDGRLVAGGFASCCNSGGTEDFALTRYNPDGSLDPSFGGDGIVRTDFLGIFTDDEIYGMALQPDGKIVAVGRAETNDRLGTYDYAVARYNATSGASATPTPTPLTTPTPAATPTPGGGSAGGLQYYPLPSPVRLFDTRPGQPACSNKGSAMAAGSTYAVAARVA